MGRLNASVKSMAFSLDRLNYRSDRNVASREVSLND